ncbi:MAG: polyribonucleotide nucleotidyltransferase [Patescibacteria group bacterium]
MQKKEYSMEIGGKTLTATFSDLTEQANGSVILSYGNTVVLATAVISKGKREGIDFFPLVVDYEERFYAAGQILGNRFQRRENKPSDEAILSGRIVDRSIRPLFETHIRNEVQVVITILSIEKDDPDILAVNAASLALGVSDIPWNSPVSAVRLGKHKGNEVFEVNPVYDFREHENVDLEIIACGKDGNINMIEAEAKEAPEEDIERALSFASQEIERINEFQRKIIAEIGKKKMDIGKDEISDEAKKAFEQEILPLVKNEIWDEVGWGKIDAVQKIWLEILKEKFPEENTALAEVYLDDVVSEVIHRAAVNENKRADGRRFDEVRSLYAEAGGFSKTLHGSGIFYRGGTHILSALTLGGPEDVQTIDGIEAKSEKHFMHHYNFPPYSSGETKRLATGRREIGHGMLAERALRAVLPKKEDFPYTIRVVSESMASNGSTSMASVCASSLALMDGGVPITRPVAGIAMGLMMEQPTTDNQRPVKYKILTDIQGPEDHHGDMDFKVAGTDKGITAIQLDIKVGGIPILILKEAVLAAKAARGQILDVINKAIPAPRPQISEYAPKIINLKIKEGQIGLLIGPGGKMIKRITAESGAIQITVDDNGLITILGKNGAAEKAAEKIKELTREYNPGEMFHGKVTRIMDFGAFVEIGPNTEGLVHISQIAPFRVNKVTDILKENDIVPVVIKEIDEKKRINLSIKDADIDFAKKKGVGPQTVS